MTEINEYGDDGFADPETDIDFSEPEPEVEPAPLEPLVHQDVATRVVVSPNKPEVYLLVNRDDEILLTLPGDRPWAVVLEEGQRIIPEG